MFAATFTATALEQQTAADLEQLTLTQLDAVIDLCYELEYYYDLDLHDTIRLARKVKKSILELAWTC